MLTRTPDDDVSDFYAGFEGWLKWAGIEQLEKAYEAIGVAIAMATDEAKRAAKAKELEAKQGEALMKRLGISQPTKARKTRKDKGLKRVVIPVPEPLPDQVTE